MNNIWVIDCEGDSLTPTKLHCLAVCNPQSEKVMVTSDYDNMRKVLTEAKVIIGHNIARFDVPVFEKLLGIKITARIVDTLALSWYLYPDRFQHGLGQWGEEFGVPKPFILDWQNQSQEEYEHRCKEDVRINTKLWRLMYRYLFDLYGSDKEVWRLLDYLALKMRCARLQEESRWKLDVSHVEENLAELSTLQEEKKNALSAVMPQVPDIVQKFQPKRFINAKGDYTKMGMDWIALCTDHGHPADYEGPIDVVRGVAPGNPSSNDQLKSWLYSLGWEPETFKDTKNKLTGEVKSIPQINKPHGGGICESIKRLYDKEPNLELLDGMSVLQHRIGILKGFLRDQQDGYLRARVNGLTNTLRFQHAEIVNLPKVDKLYASPVRSSLIAEEGMELCGSDMSSLEDRIKQHFIYPHDPDFVKEMLSETYDPHLSLALKAGSITYEQMMAYVTKEDQKTIKGIRDIFKNGNYACQYGAGVSRLAITAKVSHEEAAKVHKAYWEKNWAIKVVAQEQVVKTVNGQMWLLNPISKIWYSLRFEKDIFSTLVQGTASYVFDLWVQNILQERPQLTGQFHDEIIIQVKQGFSSYNPETKKWEGAIVKFLKDMIHKTNEQLKLNRELDIDVQFGARYSDIH